MRQYPSTPANEIPNDFPGLAAAMAANPVVFACMALRTRVFSEVRFAFRKESDLHTTQMIGSGDKRVTGARDLELLKHPWPGATSGDLLARSEQHGMLAGNAFIYREGAGRLYILRPDWVSIIFTGDLESVDWNLEGYVYQPGGKGSKKDPILLDVKDVAHYAPTPDPSSPWRGMACLTPIIQEIRADTIGTKHKLEWFEHGGTGTMVVKIDNPALNDPDKFEKVISDFKARHQATANAYDVLFFANGADANVIGSNMQETDFKAIQGAGETRIAAAFETPPVLVGLSEGLQGSSLNAGNYASSRRRFADGTIRPLWRNYCGSLEQIITTPPDSDLWYDDSDVGFLREDAKDQADIQMVNVQAVRQLLEAGFKADEAVDMVLSGDLDVLKGAHTGLFSVQLQAPGSTKMPQGEAPGETPVAQGTGPEKPAVNPAANPQGGFPKQASFEDLAMLIRAGTPSIYRLEAAPVTVNVPDQAPPLVEVNMPEIRFEPQITTPDIHVDVQPAQAPEVHIDVPPANVTVEAPPPAEVNVTTPEVRVNVEAPEPASVTVNVPKQDPPVVNVNTPKTKRKVVRDKDGRIEGVEDE
jgi:phage portal protein BeeE